MIIIIGAFCRAYLPAFLCSLIWLIKLIIMLAKAAHLILKTDAFVGSKPGRLGRLA